MYTSALLLLGLSTGLVQSIRLSNFHEERFLQQHDDLLTELVNWKNSDAGVTARINGFYNDRNTGINAIDDQLRRLYNTKQDIAAVSALNPDAKFSIDTPFTLLTTEEFTKFATGSFLQNGGKRILDAFNSPSNSSDATNDGYVDYSGTQGTNVGEPLQQQSRRRTRKPYTRRPTTKPTTKPTMNPTSSPSSSAPAPTGTKPPSGTVDWSTTSCVAPIKNQGQCGSCWAFATVGSIESANCIKNGRLQLFSEQQVTSCDKQSYGCNGGFPSGAIEYASQSGLCLSSDYPYTSGQNGNTGSCGATNCNKVPVKCTPVNVKGDDQSLVSAITKQPVVVVVAAGNNAWKQYRGGVLSACDSSQVDHAVIAVGYDAGAYIIRNSWGTSWGNNGYIHLKRNAGGRAGSCEVLSGPVYPNMN